MFNFNFCEEVFGANVADGLLEAIDNFDWDRRLKDNLIIYRGLGKPVQNGISRYYLYGSKLVKKYYAGSTANESKIRSKSAKNKNAQVKEIFDSVDCRRCVIG